MVNLHIKADAIEGRVKKYRVCLGGPWDYDQEKAREEDDAAGEEERNRKQKNACIIISSSSRLKKREDP